jgi:hypothetical protein
MLLFLLILNIYIGDVTNSRLIFVPVSDWETDESNLVISGVETSEAYVLSENEIVIGHVDSPYTGLISMYYGSKVIIPHSSSFISNLDGDTSHDQYLELDGSDTMTGDLKTNGNAYVNYDAASVDSFIYFGDDTDAQKASIQWDASDNRFYFNGVNGLWTVNGEIKSASSLQATTDIYLLNNWTDGDSVIYFYENASATGAYLQWDDSESAFVLSHDLNMPVSGLVDGVDVSEMIDTLYSETQINRADDGTPDWTTADVGYYTETNTGAYVDKFLMSYFHKGAYKSIKLGVEAYEASSNSGAGVKFHVGSSNTTQSLPTSGSWGTYYTLSIDVSSGFTAGNWYEIKVQLKSATAATVYMRKLVIWATYA